jgi:hypothetical protein
MRRYESAVSIEDKRQPKAPAVQSLVRHWLTDRRIPPEFDRRLLAKCRDAVGHNLDIDEKRFVRVEFSDAVKTKTASYETS